MLLALIEEGSSTTVQTPVKPKDTSNLFQAGSNADLFVDRAGTTGTFAVWGADAPDPGQQSLAYRGVGDASATNFDAPGLTVSPLLVYAALSNNNWIVTVNGTVKIPTTDFTVTDNVGGTDATLPVRITFAVAPAAGATVHIFRVTPVAVYAAAAARCARKRVRCYDFMWTVGATTPSATTIALVGTFS
jgi:hypothetical protein